MTVRGEPLMITSSTEEWKKWEGRVDGKFPLGHWLGGSEHSAVFLTEQLSASFVQQSGVSGCECHEFDSPR
jgi:hypothetical protein